MYGGSGLRWKAFDIGCRLLGAGWRTQDLGDKVSRLATHEPAYDPLKPSYPPLLYTQALARIWIPTRHVYILDPRPQRIDSLTLDHTRTHAHMHASTLTGHEA